MAKIGRNDSCPCGSGKKYKHCCMEEDTSNTRDRIRDQLEDAIARENPQDREQARRIADRVMAEVNATSPPEFKGLSPDDMYQAMYHPFESPSLVEFPDFLDAEPQAGALTLFLLMIDGIGEQGVKATAKGNLPRKLCQAIADEVGVHPWEDWPFDVSLRGEDDFPELHAIRLTAELAGLVEREGGKFRLTQTCERLRKQGPRALYPLLLKTYATQFNWAYSDGYDDIPHIQACFIFTLYLLAFYGESARDVDFYQEAFLDAFPSVIDEITHYFYSPEDETARCYTLRTLYRFAEFFGLVDVDVNGDRVLGEVEVRATPLLADAVRFKRTVH